MNDDYYDSELIYVVHQVQIKWKRGVDACRNDAIEAAKLGHTTIGGVGVNGCYSAARLPDSAQILRAEI